jgi:diacylglycerol kinase family enzyme
VEAIGRGLHTAGTADHRIAAVAGSAIIDRRAGGAMTRSCFLVVNPAAGGGRAERPLAAVRQVLDEAGVTHQVCASTSLEHASELAVAAAGRGDVAVAFGGDGMVGALAAAVSRAGGVLGIIPVGRGNDFARTLGVPLRPTDAARVLAAGRVRYVDLIGVGRVQADGTPASEAPAGGTPAGGTPAGGTPASGTPAGGAATGGTPASGTPASGAGELIVAGSVYLGIPAITAEIAGRSAFPRGEMAYPAAALRAVLGWRTTMFRLEVHDGTHTSTLEFDGAAAVVANSRYFGAGMMVAPKADPGDGLLDVVYIQGSSKTAMIRALTKIKKGRHVTMSQIGTGRARAVTVTVGRAVPGGADGELLPCARPLDPGARLRIRALPGVLQVVS